MSLPLKTKRVLYLWSWIKRVIKCGNSLNTPLGECLSYWEHHKCGNAVRIMTQHYLCLPPFPICATGACMFWNLPHTYPYLHALWVNPVTPRPSSFLFLPHPLQNTAIDADWRSCWGVTTKRWRVCRQLKRRYWPSSVSQRVPLTGPGDKRKWASALYLIPSRPERGIFSNWGLGDHASCAFFFSLNRGLERFRQVFENPQPSTDLASLILLFVHLLYFSSSFSP